MEHYVDVDLDILNLIKKIPENKDNATIYIRIEKIGDMCNTFTHGDGDPNLIINALIQSMEGNEKLRTYFIAAVLHAFYFDNGEAVDILFNRIADMGIVLDKKLKSKIKFK
jgi:hypothetical protein